ncbi:PVC-type heme-binding CxxCH protein [Luteolibacter sp. AS25]|uniref:PVC-type heme-binding CxxCH protein n=1 Tax=Luteolibacter sp. AS25 TaxID=3135776 RepID=UPI00398B116A
MSIFRYTSALLALSVAISMPLEAKPKAQPKKKTQSTRKASLSPEEQLKTFKLPEGFTIELVASEENGLINPIDIAFDDAGRLWTQTAEMYPLDPYTKLVGRKSLEAIKDGKLGDQPEFKQIRDLYQLKTRGTDKILVIPDPTKTATGQLHAFAEGMTIPQSILPYKDGVFVAHGSEMLFLNDEDGDGKADSNKSVLTGFGITDTHTLAHTLVRGPGGWVHFSHGALNKGKVTAVESGESVAIHFSKIGRFSLDGKHIEVVNNGLNNIWGFQMKANGQWYGTEANDLSYSLTPMHPMMGYKGIGNDKIKPYQPFPSNFHKFTVGGTGISGLAYDENGSEGFPDQWDNVGFLANPITNKINCVIADRNPDGSVISEHHEDFLSSTDDWFRPVNIEFGPDGCLYIVDWYNKIVSHNEVSRDHPDRDKSHGRIWRVRHKSQKPANIPNVAKAADEELLKHLVSENLWEKRAAWHQIADRQVKELTPELAKIATDSSQTKESRILALWSLESLDSYDLEVMKALTADKDPDIRREAVRSLDTLNPAIEDVVELTKPLINDPHYMVKEQVLRTLGSYEAANTDTIEMLVSATNPEVGGKNEFGGGYENNFQRFLALMGLENHPLELENFLNSPASENVPVANMTEAAQILPKGERAQRILAAIESGKTKLDGNTLVALSESLNEPEVLAALGDQLATKEFIELALETQPRLRTSSLAKAVEPGLKKLMASSPEDQKMAMDAAIRLQSNAINPEVMKLIGAKALSEVTPQLIEALAISPEENEAGLKALADEGSIPVSTRVKAILAYALIQPKEALAIFSALYEEADDSVKSTLTGSALGNEQGAIFLTDLINRKLLSPDQLDLDSARKLMEITRGPATKLLAKRVADLQAAEDAAAAKRIVSYEKASETLTGNPAAGEGLFNACLACHQAGGKGHDLAPSLDGSSNRNLDHLLTAIVKPNDAMEGGYRLYRIIKTNGDILEGYMYNSTENGTTIAFMGGATMFVPKEQIKSERFANGRSFMPASFGTLPEQTMVDLLSYIRGLK